jgi:chitin disaccharide deacetylase
VRYLIVNADDFGFSAGINRGIVEAHQRGILTSTSLVVNAPASEDAAAWSCRCPAMSVGLHVNFTYEGGESIVDFAHAEACRIELRRQFDHFRRLTGGWPTHLDSHHNVHRDPLLREHFLELSHDYGLPLRGHSPARYFASFYGQWDGVSHPEQVSTERLIQMLMGEMPDLITELSCHPGYVDSEFESIYAAERETELRTLCDPALAQAIAEGGLRLISFHDLPEVVQVVPALAALRSPG